MEKQGLKKVCPLLAIAQAASGQNVQNLAPCIGARSASVRTVTGTNTQNIAQLRGLRAGWKP